jgi:2-dehydro-3-deoxygalactonokinase
MRPGTRFGVSGKPILREAIARRVEGDEVFSGRLTVLGDDEQRDLAGHGAIAVARRRGLVG